MNSRRGHAGPAHGCLIAVLQSALLLVTFPGGLEGQRSQQNAAQVSGGEISLGSHGGHLAGGDRSNKHVDGRCTHTHSYRSHRAVGREEGCGESDPKGTKKLQPLQ